MSNGQRPARTAQDVAQLESDNEYLHNENERLNRELAIVTADRSRLQIENALLESKGREAMLRATRIETIVRVHSAGLVSALTDLTQERQVERNVRRQVQEQQLETETGTPPAFLRQARVADVVEPATPPPEAKPDPQEVLRRAAAEVAPRPIMPRPVPGARPSVDQATADRYFGPNTFPPASDEENLRDLAGSMQRK